MFFTVLSVSLTACNTANIYIVRENRLTDPGLRISGDILSVKKQSAKTITQARLRVKLGILWLTWLTT